MAKRYLKQKGVSYEESISSAFPEAAEKVMSLARGYKTVPTMIIGDSVVVDWDRKALDKALAERASSQTSDTRFSAPGSRSSARHGQPSRALA